MQTSVGFFLVILGAVSMTLNLYFVRSLFAVLPFVDRGTRAQVRFRQQIYAGLIVFFLVGYVVTAVAFYREWHFLSQDFVGIMFLAGAIFVGVSIRIQLRLAESLLKTMERLIPICATCRRMRIPDPDVPEAESWQAVNLWFESDAVMTHTICPACAARHAVPDALSTPAR